MEFEENGPRENEFSASLHGHKLWACVRERMEKWTAIFKEV